MGFAVRQLVLRALAVLLIMVYPPPEGKFPTWTVDEEGKVLPC